MKRKIIKTALAFSLLILFPALGTAQTTWYVDGTNTSGPWDGSQTNPFQYIQDGIDAAVHKDTVIVMPYTYVENIDFLEKKIILRSEKGPEVTVIDGGSNGSVVTMKDFPNTVAQTVILKGFTIRNGTGTDLGNGLRGGGGVFLANTDEVSLEGNIISGNTAIGLNGGYGGGIYFEDIAFEVLFNKIEGNVADGPDSAGGGFFGTSSGGTCRIFNNTIQYNHTGGNGGGGFVTGVAWPMISGNMIIANSAGIQGGGIGYENLSEYTWIYHNTYVKNTAGQRGGGLSIDGGLFTRMYSSIMWDNSAPDGPNAWIDSSLFWIMYSNIQNGATSFSGGILSWDACIDSDPRFIDPDEDDYHIGFDSPCLDAGEPSSAATYYDFEGDPREALSYYDMGADEFYTHLYYTGDATPGGDIEVKLVGVPGTFPVGLFLGSGELDPPMHTAWGDFFLLPPWLLIPLVPIPSNGILVLPAKIPVTPPAPYEIFMQALIGLNSDSLSNLCVLEVR